MVIDKYAQRAIAGLEGIHDRPGNKERVLFPANYAVVRRIVNHQDKIHGTWQKAGNEDGGNKRHHDNNLLIARGERVLVPSPKIAGCGSLAPF